MELFFSRDGEIKITRATEQKWWETLAIIENKYQLNIIHGGRKFRSINVWNKLNIIIQRFIICWVYREKCLCFSGLQYSVMARVAVRLIRLGSWFIIKSCVFLLYPWSSHLYIIYESCSSLNAEFVLCHFPHASGCFRKCCCPWVKSWCHKSMSKYGTSAREMPPVLELSLGS